MKSPESERRSHCGDDQTVPSDRDEEHEEEKYCCDHLEIYSVKSSSSIYQVMFSVETTLVDRVYEGGGAGGTTGTHVPLTY